MKTEELPLTVQPANQLATQEPSVALMLQTFIEKGITPESVGAFSQLCELKERMDVRAAEKAFAAAMHALQTAMPVIVAQSVIPNRGKYAKFEDIMEVVKPLLRQHGFTESFSQVNDGNKITETCRLKHIGGHSESNSFTVRLGGKADSDTQADCKASTTAKRNALLNALNIVIRQDVLQGFDGPMNEGGKLTQAQADALRDWVERTGSNVAKFLDLAGADRFEDIKAGKLEVLEAFLRSKEKGAPR